MKRLSPALSSLSRQSLTLGFATVMTVAALGSAVAQESEPPHIAVTAEGSATVVPDMAVTQFTVLREAPDTVTALEEANTAMADVIEAMKSFGIEQRDLQTAGFNVRPIYDHRRREPTDNGEPEQPRITGYAVSNSLTVRIRDLTKTGEVLTRAIELGVNADGNLNLTTAEPDTVIDEARRDAVEQAMAKAKTLADAAGVSLGPIVSLTEGGYSRPPMPMARMEMAMADQGAAVPVEAGENQYTVNVTLKIAIDQPSE
ncbi:SIMPL domain-containing protein [Notoacmeibacter sp. MSK16QG-6]|uniref:SIMPL domain-containing protein n=1 Tax=Notoacmeibacter sp. MSK16QG-6 TaxID=2957982 RepID=UPI0020A2042B|nr:SIMPL domain-containing protein [Notoacmeibacter sp. MSK16QG-6]MCP1199813.1 SIMPL domain-containing protein [Notoacmeibacter sp. MSK16QG-6]